MKKLLLYLLAFILICFIIPIMLTKRTVPTIAKQEKTTQKIEENNLNYEYNKYGTINLLHKKTGEVEKVN